MITRRPRTAHPIRPAVCSAALCPCLTRLASCAEGGLLGAGQMTWRGAL